MQKQLTCLICSQQYRQNNVPRLLPKCGHSYCQACIKSNLEEKDSTFKIVCPQDGLQMAFEDKDINNFPKNIALIKLLSTKEAKKKDQSFKDGSLNESNIAKHSNNDADQQDKELITVINQSTKGTQVVDNKSGEDLDWNLEDTCLIHGKPLQIVCIKDKTKICSTCAIFGDHKGHDFKSIDEVAKDKQKRYDGILQLIDKKQMLESRLSGKETKQEFSRNLNTKKQALCKDIKAKFSRLADAVKNAQKNVMDKLNKNFTSLQDRLKDQLKMPDSINKKYQKWEERAYRQIKSFDGQNNYEEQLKLLNYQKTGNQLNILDEGEFIMNQIQRSIALLDEQKVEMTSSISVEFNHQLQKKIPEYAVVNVKQPKKVALTVTSPRQSNAKSMGFKGIYQQIMPKKISSTPQQSTISIQSNVEKPLPEPPLLGHQNISNPDDFLLQLHEDHITMEEQPVVREIIDMKQQIPVLSLKQQVPKQSFGHQHTPSQYSVSIPQDTNRKTAYKDSSFVFEKLPAKKKPKIKLAEKYEKILDGIISDQLQTVDFTNAELGDQIMIQIVECIRSKKVKTLKLIRNKLTDEGLDKMFPYFGGIITLNLSQNLLTERFIQQLISNLPRMPSLRSIILSQNKIKQRNVKVRLQEIKKYQVIVSL